MRMNDIRQYFQSQISPKFEIQVLLKENIQSLAMQVYQGLKGDLNFSDLTLFETKGYAHILFDLDQKITNIEEMNAVDAVDEIINLGSALGIEQSERHLPCYVGGFVGFMAYDSVRLVEAIPDRHPNVDTVPDVCFKRYKGQLTIDVLNCKIVCIQSTPISELFLKSVQDLINQFVPLTFSVDMGDDMRDLKVEADVSDIAYMDLVRQAQNHIKAGDVFQLVLSRKFQVQTQAKAFEIYQVLRQSIHAPYYFYFEEGHNIYFGASPEKLISVEKNEIEVRPLAGTRAIPLNATQQQIKALSENLLSDEKELAEHMMLVDLARNDVGSLAQLGTVKVTQLAEVLKFTHIMHLSSTVQGRLSEDKTRIDALQKSLPAGTLSGAPKISAMKLIDALEGSRRGLYGGAFCAIDVNGALDSCIAIRMGMMSGSYLSVRAGAGIVLDSDPESEAEETRQKSMGLLRAVKIAETLTYLGLNNDDKVNVA